MSSVKESSQVKELENSSINIIDMPEAFTESGQCDDEITLVFDNSNKLYVSKNFLRYASPVFMAMFDHDYKENKENSVSLTGKNYDDFLEFLLCIHPRIFKPITDKNVLRIVEIANEYQVTSIIKKCKETMMTWLQTLFGQARTKGHYLYQAEYLRPCLRIIAKAHELSYNDVVQFAAKTIAKFGHILYNKGQTQPPLNPWCSPYITDKRGDETYSDIKEDCMNMFQELSLDIKYKIVTERLLLLNEECDIKD
ncbi:uncharacterized protein LOC132745177 [Ruditapes philippinarum]|uniref:uncharacterized protein LOC132745177 n=1 Tax=Ruditapes philippinarum TaxID=129788 RepID=UPI00295A6710|nr:uncharacterized protein LOC132745177 [Ruditapes philippinarum]